MTKSGRASSASLFLILRTCDWEFLFAQQSWIHQTGAHHCFPLIWGRRGDAECTGSNLEYNLCSALAWRVGCFTDWIKAVSFCHGVNTRGEFAWRTMEDTKRLSFHLLLAAQLCLSSTQVLRIGKRNSWLRAAALAWPSGTEGSVCGLFTVWAHLSLDPFSTYLPVQMQMLWPFFLKVSHPPASDSVSVQRHSCVVYHESDYGTTCLLSSGHQLSVRMGRTKEKLPWLHQRTKFTLISSIPRVLIANQPPVCPY